MRVVIHNQSVIPFPDEEGFDVSTEFQTNIEISRKSISHLSEPYSNCLSEIDPSIFKKKNTKTLQQLYIEFGQTNYNQKYCLKVCFQVEYNILDWIQ